MSKFNEDFDHPRVPPPQDDDRSLRDYGRQLAMDSLLEVLLTDRGTSRDAAAGTPSSVQPKKRFGGSLHQFAALAAAAALLLLFVLGVPWVKKIPKDHENTLTATWRIKPTGAAEYRILSPTRIRLEQGELRIFTAGIPPGKNAASELMVETPSGKAVASGTDFFIGTYQPQATFQGEPMHTSLTRVLVLTGTVTLANALGSVSGGPQSLLAAEPGKPPAQIAVTANSGFGVDLFRQIARQSPGKNLFFSPYSLSSALAMAAEGARGETAEEMGKALHFPAAARRIGDDAQLLPWNTAMIHTGMAELNRRLNGQDKADSAVRKRIDELRKEFAESQKRVEKYRKERKYEKLWEAVEKGNAIARELNSSLAQVDQYELRVANGLWGDKGHPFQQAFLDTLNTHYATGGIALMDFQNDPEAARRKIND
jgi:hypothetical protein